MWLKAFLLLSVCLIVKSAATAVHAVHFCKVFLVQVIDEEYYFNLLDRMLTMEYGKVMYVADENSIKKERIIVKHAQKGLYETRFKAIFVSSEPITPGCTAYGHFVEEYKRYQEDEDSLMNLQEFVSHVNHEVLVGMERRPDGVRCKYMKGDGPQQNRLMDAALEVRAKKGDKWWEKASQTDRYLAMIQMYEAYEAKQDVKAAAVIKVTSGDRISGNYMPLLVFIMIIFAAGIIALMYHSGLFRKRRRRKDKMVEYFDDGDNDNEWV